MNDLISRQAAIKDILDRCLSDYDSEYECGYDDGLRQGIFRLKHLPTIDPVKHSRWVFPTDIVGFGRCKNCKALWDISLIRNKFFKHCPKCGAKMDGGEK